MRTISAQARRTIVAPIAFGLGLLVVWEVVCTALTVSKFVIPRPSEIVIMCVLRWDTVWPNALQTLATTLSGFALGVSIGFVLGVVLGASQSLYKTVFPTLIGLTSIPKVALVPLMVLWAGIGTVPAILTSTIIVIFPIMVVVATGIATMDPELNDVLRSLGATRLVALAKVGIPQSLPHFF